MSYQLTLKCRSSSPFTKITVYQLLYERFLPNFHIHDGNVAGNKNVKSADLENVCQGHRLQKSLYLGLYTTDFNKTFAKMT